MTPSPRLTRRSMLAVLNLSAGGLVLGLYPTLGVAAPAAKASKGLTPNVFLHLSNDGRLTVVCHRSEMGQGIRSSLAGLLADELGADLSLVNIEQADGDEKYGDQNTDGSSSIRGKYDALRLTAATARSMLETAAAQRWRVSPTLCFAKNHVVTNQRTQAKLTFAELADAAGALPVPRAEKVTLRPQAELEHVGTNMPLLDGPAYVTGKAVYGADVTLPGTLVAVIARPPVVGGTVRSVDGSRAMAVRGVKRVVQVRNPVPPYVFQPWGGVAVIADNTWAAMRGRAALDITWTDGDNAAYDSDEYRKTLSESVNTPGVVARNVGNVEQALAAAARVVEAEYHVPHLAHLPMEPPVALAHFHDGRCEVWASTQNPQEARENAAKVLGIDPKDVTVHVTFVGGGFGRKSKADFVAEAALLSKEMGAPVRVQWTREDDVQHDYYNAVSTQKLTAGLDASGSVTAWRHRTAFTPIASLFAPISAPLVNDLQQGVLDLALAAPNVRAETGRAPAHVRVGWLRSVYNIFHAFAVGSFVDELAFAKGQDPKATWLEVIGPARKVSLEALGVKQLPNYGATLEDHPVDAGRLRNVIERVTQISNWADRKQNGKVLGLAAHRSFLSYVGVVVSAVTRPDGRIAIDDAWVVVDAGLIVNADRVRSQMEGAVVFGISHAFYGGATMKKGATVQSNFHDAKLARIRDVPRVIEVEIIKSTEKPGGVGEPCVPPVAPAIANAVFALTGRRIRRLPMQLEVSV